MSNRLNVCYTGSCKKFHYSNSSKRCWNIIWKVCTVSVLGLLVGYTTNHYFLLALMFCSFGSAGWTRLINIFFCIFLFLLVHDQVGSVELLWGMVGKLSEMHCSDYKLITAANMRPGGAKLREWRHPNRDSPGWPSSRWILTFVMSEAWKLLSWMVGNLSSMRQLERETC